MDLFFSPKVSLKSRGGRTSSLGIENNPGVRRTGRAASSPGQLRKSRRFGPMRSKVHRDPPLGGRGKKTHRTSALPHGADVYRARTEVKTVWESSLFTVTHLTSCVSVRKWRRPTKRKKKREKYIYIYPYYKSLKNSSFLFTSRVVKKITPAVLVLK